MSDIYICVYTCFFHSLHTMDPNTLILAHLKLELEKINCKRTVTITGVEESDDDSSTFRLALKIVDIIRNVWKFNISLNQIDHVARIGSASPRLLLVRFTSQLVCDSIVNKCYIDRGRQYCTHRFIPSTFEKFERNHLQTIAHYRSLGFVGPRWKGMQCFMGSVLIGHAFDNLTFQDLLDHTLSL